MVTVIKQNPRGEEQTRYSGDIVEQDAQHVVIQALWTRKQHNLGYVTFELGDHFTEYYYTHRWYNIFAIATAAGKQKGWYCNITEPAIIKADRIEQVDLLLDVWVDPDGTSLVLDEDEFTANMTLSTLQRQGAKDGLQALLRMIADRREVFSDIADTEEKQSVLTKHCDGAT